MYVNHVDAALYVHVFIMYGKATAKAHQATQLDGLLNI